MAPAPAPHRDRDHRVKYHVGTPSKYTAVDSTSTSTSLTCAICTARSMCSCCTTLCTLQPPASSRRSPGTCVEEQPGQVPVKPSPLRLPNSALTSSVLAQALTTVAFQGLPFHLSNAEQSVFQLGTMPGSLLVDWDLRTGTSKSENFLFLPTGL